MQIVIDIDGKDYLSIKNGHIPFSILNSIMNSTSLLKGHGKLIDADDLIAVVDEEIRSLKDMHDWGRVYGAEIVREIIKDEPTIIKADKKSEGKK